LGWCLEARAPLAATLVVNFFVGLGTGTINTGISPLFNIHEFDTDVIIATVYGQDLKAGQGGAVSASVSSHDSQFIPPLMMMCVYHTSLILLDAYLEL